MDKKEIIRNAASIAVNIEQYHLHSVCTERKRERDFEEELQQEGETQRKWEKFQVHRSIIIDTYKRQITA